MSTYRDSSESVKGKDDKKKSSELNHIEKTVVKFTET
jgi:hypothetical protein